VKEIEFRAWLEARRWNGKPLSSISSRMSKARRFEKMMPALGFGAADLDAAFEADGMTEVTERLADWCRRAANTGEAPVELVGQAINPASRINNVASSVRNYRQFRENPNGSGGAWPAVEELRAAFLDRVPDFERFDLTDNAYERVERAYKNALIAKVRQIVGSEDDDEQVGRRIYRALIPSQGALLTWQVEDDFTRKFSELAPTFFAEIAKLARTTEPTVDAVMQAASRLELLHQRGVTSLTLGQVSRITLTVLGMVRPSEAAPFAIGKAQQLAKLLTDGPIFTGSTLERAQVEQWLGLLRRIEAVMRSDWGWAPRDLVDVQGFAWAALDDKWEIEGEMDDAQVLARFAGNPHFDALLARWTPEQASAFCAIARGVHDAGLDWYHVNLRGNPARFGRKPNPDGPAQAAMGYLEARSTPYIKINDSVSARPLDLRDTALTASDAAALVETLERRADEVAAWKPLQPVRAGRWPDEAGTDTQGDETPIWLVTARYGEDDGVEQFRARGEWNLLQARAGRMKECVAEMRPGDRIVMRDYIPRATNLPFDAPGQHVTAMRIRGTGTVTEQRGDGVSVGVAWDGAVESRVWYLYTNNDLVWPLRLDNEMAQKLAAFIFKGVPQDYDWFTARWFGREQTEAERSVIADPTNLILYGPPGTGKTFATAERAVRLCGEVVPDDRNALMDAYTRLSKEGRIEFVTFHQSMAYEEFVEGLRPSSLDEAGQPLATGFRLAPAAGVFRRISRRAETSTGPGPETFAVGEREVFKMSLGEAANQDDAYVFEEAIRDGHIVLGFDDVDWSDPKFAHRDEIMAVAQALNPGTQLNARSGAVQMPHLFRNWMNEGDWVVVSKGTRQFRAIGIIIGGYRFVPREGGGYAHQRAVRWLWADRGGVPVEEIYTRGFSQRTITGMFRSELNIPALERYANSQQQGSSGIPQSFVLIIDEINRANISKVFGELITLLEPDKRIGAANELRVRLPYSGDSLGVPANLHIIGTMNTADRSIALIDKALRRRFTFEEMMPDYTVEGMNDEVVGAGVTLAVVLQAINDRVEYLLDREHQIGQGWLLGSSNKTQLDAKMRNAVIPLIAEYFFEDWGRTADVLGGREDNPFLEAITLKAPPGITDEAPRVRWSMRSTFAPDAYTRLIAG
jgi:5-methylcytosine-specific restriction protein B